MILRAIVWSVLAIAGLGVSATAALADDRHPEVDTARPTPVVYPKVAQRWGEEGTVVVRVYVNEFGKPANVSVARSSGYVDLDNAAVDTVMNWHYVPAIRDGAIASDWARVQVIYKLPQSP
ncbi:MAG TPA: energy transducer TonB [Rhizomicrobium sp.]|jgi:protein TonB|nr:energy transducer TonB [Rhizomicrobium sp.]